MKDKFSDNLGQKILFVASLLSLIVIIYILNRLFPLYGDDWDYTFIWNSRGGETHRISSFSDIIISQYNHYMQWSGRSVVHTIDQFLLMIGTGWHDLLNTLAYVLFTLLIYKISNKNNRINVVIYLLIILACWLCLPGFFSSVFWITHSANYLWGTLIILTFIYPFYTYYRTENAKGGIIKVLFMFFAGIIAGWTNENMAIALVFFLVMLILLLRYQKIFVPSWIWVGLLGVIIGCTLMFIAPGNYVRMKFSYYNIGYLGRLSIMPVYYFKYLLLLSGIYVVLFVFYIKKVTLKDKPKLLFASLLFFISAHVGFFVMIGSPEFPYRVLFGVVAFIIVAIGILYANINLKYPRLKLINLLLIIILLAAFCVDYIGKYRRMSQLSDYWNPKEIFLKEQKEKGIMDIVFIEDVTANDGFGIFVLDENPNSWTNRKYARYYGVHSVKRIPKE